MALPRQETLHLDIYVDGVTDKVDAVKNGIMQVLKHVQPEWDTSGIAIKVGHEVGGTQGQLSTKN